MPVGDNAPDAYIRRTESGSGPRQGGGSFGAKTSEHQGESVTVGPPLNGPSGDHAPADAPVPQGTNHTVTTEPAPSGTEHVSQGGSPGVGMSGVDSDGDYDDD